MSFYGLAGSSYTVQYRDDLANGTSWQNLQNFPAQTNSGPREVVVTAPGPSRRFYRVLTPMLP